MRDHASTSFGDLAVYALFVLASLISGGTVIGFFVVASAPIVAIFPEGSGAQEIVLGIAILWGVVVGCVVAVFTLGPWHRHRAHGRRRSFREVDGFLLPPARPLRYAHAPRSPVLEFAEYDDGYDAYDEDGLLVLADEAEPRGPALSRYARGY